MECTVDPSILLREESLSDLGFFSETIYIGSGITATSFVPIYIGLHINGCILFAGQTHSSW